MDRYILFCSHPPHPLRRLQEVVDDVRPRLHPVPVEVEGGEPRLLGNLIVEVAVVADVDHLFGLRPEVAAEVEEGLGVVFDLPELGGDG